MSPAVVSTSRTSSDTKGAPRQVKWGAKMAFTYDQGNIPSDIGTTIKQSESIRKQLAKASTPAEKENLLVAFPMFRQMQQPQHGGVNGACLKSRANQDAEQVRVATAGAGLSARPLAPVAKPSSSILKKSSYRQHGWVVPRRREIDSPGDCADMPQILSKRTGLKEGAPKQILPDCGTVSPMNDCFYDAVDDTCGWWA